MSGALKSIGKVFKKVIRVVKKVALPVLAIGAVVLTGGAALGVLPALGGAGGLLASVGIKGALAGVLTTAAKGAAFGALGSALTGGNIVKGATKGLLIGGITGGIGAAMGGTAATAAQTASGAVPTGTGASDGAATIGVTPDKMAGTAGFDQTMSAIAPEINAASAAELGTGGIGSAATAPVAMATAPQVAQVAATSGGPLGWFNNMNPVTQGSIIQGIGGALTAGADAKDRRKELERQEASYSDNSGLFPGYAPAYGASRYDAAIYGGKVKYDSKTGQLVPR